MKKTFRLSITWLHTWAGLLLGWLCFAIFTTGTATYFRHEITRWMKPELRGGASPATAARTAVAKLETIAPKSETWFISLPGGRDPSTVIYWREAGPRRFANETIDPISGEKTKARESFGGEFFYRFHFQLLMPHPWGRYLAGAAAMFMFVALISGVIAHRRFFIDMFKLRRGAGSFRAWLDFHNLTGTLALPFYIMISFSALVIFMQMYLPWPERALAAGKAADSAARASVRGGALEKTAAQNPWVASAPIDAMLDEVARRWGDGDHSAARISFANRGAENATVSFTRTNGARVSTAAQENLTFNGVTGALVAGEKPTGGAGSAVHGTLYGLHLAHFAGPLLRWLFFLMGALGCALIASGMVLWTVKRRPQEIANAAAFTAETGKTRARFSFGHSLVERLNLAAIAGLVAAVAVLFWANRLLPAGMAGRGDAEVLCFLGAWAAMVLHAVARPMFGAGLDGIMRAWCEQLWFAAGLFLLLPAVDACSGPFLKEAIARSDAAYIGFHAVMIFAGLMLVCAARRVGGKRMRAGNVEGGYVAAGVRKSSTART